MVGIPLLSMVGVPLLSMVALLLVGIFEHTSGYCAAEPAENAMTHVVSAPASGCSAGEGA